MISNDVKLIEYSKSVDLMNCITHAVGAVLAIVGLIAAIQKASSSDNPCSMISAVIYGISMIAVYTVSAVYHGLPQGENKRRARLADHVTVPLLLAGTATPCALVTLYEIKPLSGIFVISLAWFCALFGMFSKLFFFEKLKTVCMAVYIIGGAVMLLSAVPFIGSIDSFAFELLIVGSAVYIIGGIFCAVGRSAPFMHVIFHVFILAGSAIHYYVIYSYVI